MFKIIIITQKKQKVCLDFSQMRREIKSSVSNPKAAEDINDNSYVQSHAPRCLGGF
jgi:hypothetical protein